MGTVRFIAACVVLLLLAVGTAAAEGEASRFALGEAEWRESVAARGLDPDEVIYPFAATPEMTAWAEGVLARFGRVLPTDRLRILQQLLFDRSEFPFQYEQPVNLTAAEAFAERRGNCMSFTALFIALSREMGVPTFLVSVARDPQVEKVDDLVVVSRHVVAGYSSGGVLYVYDFYLASEAPYLSRRAVDDVKASAMFHTNLGATAIRAGDLALARRHLELGVRLDPDLASAWVNLGVVRSRSGDLHGALDAYDRALRSAPEHSSALTNMAYVYQQLGQTEEARSALRAAAEGRSSPFTLIALADVEATRGNFDIARGFLSRARRSHGRVPEVYDALARLERRSGNPLAAERYERKAAKVRKKLRDRQAAEGSSGANQPPAAPDPGLPAGD